MRSNAWRSALRQVKSRRSTKTQRLSAFGQTLQRPRGGLHPGYEWNSTTSPTCCRSYSTAPASSPELPKKDGQAARASLRTANKRQERGSNGLPHPPPVPDWFLKHNVRLCGDAVPESHVKHARKVINLQNPFDDRVLLSIPYDESTHTEPSRPAPLSADFFSSSAAQDGAELAKPGDPSEANRPLREQSASVIDDGKPALVTTTSGGLVSPEEELASQAGAAAGDRTGDGKSTSKTAKSNKDRKAGLLSTKDDPSWWALLHGQMLAHAVLRSAKAGNAPRNLSISWSDPMAFEEIDRFVESIARTAHADLMRIDAADIAELAGTYVNPGEPGSGSISALSYDTYRDMKAVPQQQPQVSNASKRPDDTFQPFEAQNEDDDEMMPSGPMSALHKRLGQIMINLGGPDANVVGIDLPSMTIPHTQSPSSPRRKPDAEEFEPLDRWQQMKLRSFFDSLLTSVVKARETDLSGVEHNFARAKFTSLAARISNPDLRRQLDHISEENRGELHSRYVRDDLKLDQARNHVATHISEVFGKDKPATIEAKDLETEDQFLPTKSSQGTIVHVRDLGLIHDTPHGEAVLDALISAVRQRQKKNEPIMVIGTTLIFARGVTSPFDDGELDSETDHQFLRINYPHSSSRRGSNVSLVSAAKLPAPTYPVMLGYPRLLEINLRSIYECIRQLGIPTASPLFSEATRAFLFVPGTQSLATAMLSPEQVQNLVLTAEGFRALYTTSQTLDLTHIAIALSISNQVEKLDKQSLATFDQPKIIFQENESPTDATDSPRPQPPKERKRQSKRKLDLDRLRRFASSHEQKLFGGIVDPENIKTTYNDIHVAHETIDALKTVTTLALLRPEAFSYGVLANDRLPGLLLYGPPGTGKTLLAKAVAKDASATVLEVSGAQVYEKYVGEGEKMVKAVFSLARRLSPCVVFIDEADALFGTRDSGSQRTTHREIINEFLREWDGMDDRGVFIMVATNRPFDLDDAVLRRLPRRILVDLPTAKDREGILKIHLKGETLADDIRLEELAEQTPFYSGSDLKNVCVAAALAAVKEENDLLVKYQDSEGFKLPEKRTLTKAHFEKATLEISASISEDMRSLDAIKKFDEQYGDRKGRRKKTNYGFGDVESKDDERNARVRSQQQPPSR